MTFIKEYLLNKNYKWGNDDRSATLANGPTRKPFDRFSGDSLLRMINLFDQFIATLTISQGQKIECLIQENLPPEAKSELSVFNWLRGKHVYNNTQEII